VIEKEQDFVMAINSKEAAFALPLSLEEWMKLSSVKITFFSVFVAKSSPFVKLV